MLDRGRAMSSREIMRALEDVRPGDQFVEATLKICDGSRFQAFHSLGNIVVMFPNALFTISARDRQLRTFMCAINGSGSLVVTDIAFGASDNRALRLIASHRDKCAGRPAFSVHA